MLHGVAIAMVMDDVITLNSDPNTVKAYVNVRHLIPCTVFFIARRGRGNRKVEGRRRRVYEIMSGGRVSSLKKEVLRSLCRMSWPEFKYRGACP
jgi:hypothetical protein